MSYLCINVVVESLERLVVVVVVPEMNQAQLL